MEQPELAMKFLTTLGTTLFLETLGRPKQTSEEFSSLESSQKLPVFVLVWALRRRYIAFPARSAEARRRIFSLTVVIVL